MSNETEKKYYLQDGREVSLRTLIAKEPEWARSRIIEGEKAITLLATIERDTAEKCRELILGEHLVDPVDDSDDVAYTNAINDTADAITHHYNLGETP